MFAPVLYMLAIGCTPPELITVQKFTLETNKGENVFHERFDQRWLANAFQYLALKFHAVNKQFEFEFHRSSIFAPNAIIRKTGNVSEHSQYCVQPFVLPIIYPKLTLLHRREAMCSKHRTPIFYPFVVFVTMRRSLSSIALP